jgi:hypothetical protein
MFKPKRKLERNPAAGGDNDEPIPEVAGALLEPESRGEESIISAQRLTTTYGGSFELIWHPRPHWGT